MSLPISSIVNVSVSIAPTVPPKQGFGTAAVVTDEDVIAGGLQPNRIQFYGSIQEVAIDYATTTETYKVAQSYFGQNPSPRIFATISQGIAETEVQALSAAELVSNSWYGILLLKDRRDVQATLDVAAWAEARTKVFAIATNNILTLTIGDVTSHAYLLFNGNYSRTSCVYSSTIDEYPDAAMLGKAFTTNFSAPNSVITLKFKSLAGITTETVNTSQKSGLDEKRCNVLTSVAGASMFTEGYMSSQLFFDERHGVDWLVGEIESNVFSYLLSRTTKVPLTDKGGASIQQQVIRALDSAVSNGLLGGGETSAGDQLPLGYSVSVQKVADMAPADKANRIAPTVSFVALLAGAVHFVQINGTVER